MSKEKRRVPRLRFPGFTGDWEQRKLGDIATITGGGTPSTNISEYWNGDIDWYSPVEIGEKRYASGSIRKITKLGLEKSSAKILPVGTVLFTSRAGIGNTAILQVEGCTNQGFQSITPNSKELDTYFLYTMTPKLKRYGEVTGAGSTFVEVSGKQMEQMNLMIPSLDEQKHVSQLFKAMDDAITLHQRKLNHLILKKKSLLQKLFPKNGDRYPELRFPGFTDAWEQRKLGEVVKSYSGGTPTASNKDYYGGDIPFIRSAEINSDTTELYITQKGLDNSSAKIVEKGTILYAMYGATSGEVGISKINGAINQAILAMIPLEYNGKIIAQYLRKNKESIIGKYLQGGQGNLSANIILELPIQLPGLEESNQIANFLESFDNIITLHQRKLDHLQLQKKALLQQLFV